MNWASESGCKSWPVVELAAEAGFTVGEYRQSVLGLLTDLTTGRLSRLLSAICEERVRHQQLWKEVFIFDQRRIAPSRHCSLLRSGKRAR